MVDVVLREQDVELQEGEGGESAQVGLIQPVHASLAAATRLDHQVLKKGGGREVIENVCFNLIH